MSPNGQVKNHTRENPGKGKNILSKPITTLHTAEINTLTDLKLHVEKQLEFSEYWHSEEKVSKKVRVMQSLVAT